MRAENAGLEAIGCREILMHGIGQKLSVPVCMMLLVFVVGAGEAWADAASKCQMLNWEGELTEAFPVCREAAEQGDAYALNFIGVSYADGEQVAQDARQSIVWFRKAADQGYAPAQTNLGMAYAIGFGVNQDAVQASVWLQQAAEQGEAVACDVLGLSHEQGEKEIALQKFAATMLSRSGACHLDGEQSEHNKLCAVLIRELITKLEPNGV